MPTSSFDASSATAAMHLVRDDGSEAFVTLDQKLARRARGFENVTVRLA